MTQETINSAEIASNAEEEKKDVDDTISQGDSASSKPDVIQDEPSENKGEKDTIYLQGDHRNSVSRVLIESKLVDANKIVMHGAE